MVFEDILVGLKTILDGIGGVAKTIIDYQHGNPIAFAIVAVVVLLLIGGVAVTQGKTITGLIVGNFEIVDDVPLWDQYGLASQPNISNFSLVIASGWSKGWDGWRQEKVNTDDISTQLFLRWDQTLCSERILETSGKTPVVWEEILEYDPGLAFFSDNEMTILTRCGGLTNEINRITFTDEIDAMNTIAAYGENGTICNDDTDLTVDIVYMFFGSSCYYLVDEENRRMFYTKPLLNPRNNYLWFPTFKGVSSSTSQGTSYLTLQKLELSELGQEGVLTPLVSTWVYLKNTIKKIESTLNAPPLISGIMMFVENAVLFVALILMGLMGIGLILVVGGVINK